MAHDHHHHHGESASNYFTEQLLTILVCGLIGYAGIEMYRTDRLGFLAVQFQKPVLFGGIGILVLVVLRSIAVWREAGEMQAHLQACAQDHVHTADCNHEHFHEHGHSHGPDEEHDHEHSHDMSWLFARMLILVFPVLLYFIGLPASGFSKERLLQLAGNDAALGTENLKKFLDGATVIEGPKEEKDATVRVFKTTSGLKIRETTPLKGGDPKLELISEAGTPRKFNELNDAALNEGKRKYMEGETVILEGRFKQLADKEFSLFRMKMTCCAADTVPLKVRIIVPQALSNFSDYDWVTVKGQLQFLRVQGQDRFIPVIMVAKNSDVAKTSAQSEYEQ